MVLNNLVLFFLLIAFGIFFYKFFVVKLGKYKPQLLIDNQFNKPQAFHEAPISMAGGIGIFFSFLIIIFNFWFYKNLIFIEYLSFCTLFFLLGLVDDLKIKVKPKIRLVLMILLLIILVIFNNFYVQNTGIKFLNSFLENDVFALFFVCLCFLFIINGSNLVDGYNGLLSIHTLIILINLFFINYYSGNSDLAFLILSGMLTIIIFLKYNFPNAKVFLGDSGSYFLGTFTAISIIKTSILNPSISPFYFCILLFYLFFEVFFSFIRKIVVEKKSPLFPDRKHLHMLIYKYFLEKTNDKLKSNYRVSVILNLIYLIFILPAIFMMENGIFCKYYSLILFITYLLSYKMIYKKTK